MSQSYLLRTEKLRGSEDDTAQIRRDPGRMIDLMMPEEDILRSEADTLPYDVAGTASNVFVSPDDIYSDHGDCADGARPEKGHHRKKEFLMPRHCSEIGRASCRERV